MPIRIPDELPAGRALEREGVEIIRRETAIHQDIRPVRIILLNLMPNKEQTEIQFARLLGNTPLQIDLTLMTTASYEPRNTPPGYLDQFYRTLDDVRDEFFDGLIVTGAPIERLPFEEVEYWDELMEIVDWSTAHVARRLGICWGAQALMYHRYGVEKYELPRKLFGVYQHFLAKELAHTGLLTGFTDRFPMPVSRYTGNRFEAVSAVPELEVIAQSVESGVAMVIDTATRDLFVLNHLEYDAQTLADEYDRDRRAGLDTALPENYFPDDDPSSPPRNRWRPYAYLLVANWIKQLYLDNPYDLSTLAERRTAD